MNCINVKKYLDTKLKNIKIYNNSSKIWLFKHITLYELLNYYKYVR